MSVQWQGDHKLLDKTREKQDFESELRRLGYDPSQFVVLVRREVGAPGPEGKPTRYKLYVNQVGPGQKTLILEGGPGNNWIAQFVRELTARRR